MRQLRSAAHANRALGLLSQVGGVVKGDWEAIAPLVLMTIAIVTIVELVRADDPSPCAPVCDCALKGCCGCALHSPCCGRADRQAWGVGLGGADSCAPRWEYGTGIVCTQGYCDHSTACEWHL